MSQWPDPLLSAPDDEELEEMIHEGDIEATDGECVVEPDGVCRHGYPSWLLYLGLA